MLHFMYFLSKCLTKDAGKYLHHAEQYYTNLMSMMQNRGQQFDTMFTKKSIWNSYNQKSKHQIDQSYRNHL